MWEESIKQWRILKSSPPGRRFKLRYQRSKRLKERGALLGLVVNVALAAVMIVIGVVLVFFPGPAILFFFIAGALLASNSLTIARFMDWAEVNMRAVGRWCLRHWRKLSTVGKATFILACALVAAAVMFYFFSYISQQWGTFRSK